MTNVRFELNHGDTDDTLVMNVDVYQDGDGIMIEVDGDFVARLTEEGDLYLFSGVSVSGLKLDKEGRIKVVKEKV